jgi:hypothetical protein
MVAKEHPADALKQQKGREHGRGHLAARVDARVELVAELWACPRAGPCHCMILAARVCVYIACLCLPAVGSVAL